MISLPFSPMTVPGNMILLGNIIILRNTSILRNVMLLGNMIILGYMIILGANLAFGNLASNIIMFAGQLIRNRPVRLEDVGNRVHFGVPKDGVADVKFRRSPLDSLVNLTPG
jgi:hypothetical protein